MLTSYMNYFAKFLAIQFSRTDSWQAVNPVANANCVLTAPAAELGHGAGELERVGGGGGHQGQEEDGLHGGGLCSGVTGAADPPNPAFISVFFWVSLIFSGGIRGSARISSDFQQAGVSPVYGWWRYSSTPAALIGP